MEWLNLHTSVLDSAEFVGATPVERSTWICLQRYCIGQENDGRIVGASTWGDRKWQQLAKVTQREVKQPSELWTWDGEDILVWEYPLDKQHEIEAKREAGRSTASKRWDKQPAPANSSATNSADTERNRKGIGIGKEGEGNAGADAPHARPDDLNEVKNFFSEHGSTSSEAEAYFDHFSANGWKVGGRTAMKDWHAAARKWIRNSRSGDFGSKSGVPGKISSVGSPVQGTFVGPNTDFVNGVPVESAPAEGQA